MTVASPRPRPARRVATDLPFSFADRGLAKALAAERSEPDWLRAERIAALEAFEALPLEPNQLYTTYLDLRNAELMTARPYLKTASVPNAIASTKLPDGVAGLIDLREDGVAGLVLEPAAVAAGVILETFGQALARDPDGLRTQLEGGAGLPDDDKLAALVRGFWSQGVRLQIPAGVRLERPIVIRWAAGMPDRALIGRTIITVGDGADASIVEELTASGPAIACAAGETVPQALLAGTLEVTLGRDAKLAVASLQELPAGTIAFQHRHAVIGEGASLHWALAQLGSRLVRSRVDNRLEGDRSSVEQVEIVFGGEDQLFDLTSYTRHIGRDTTGNLLSKGALLDRARSFMKGMIVIDRSAVGTDSFLGEFGMNLSKATRSVAIPSLEIDQPDCRRAAHASSVGPIDESQLFYLESRGIPPDEARKFIVLGFLEPVVARVPLASAQDRLRVLLEAKWDAGIGAGAGNDAAA
ncbi:MAG: SufD family Fe-S cluster assembly protein [Candidatus Limnocylindrales bacterium]|nr:SufD family Fe-S cluster assembly protein [Candidatus Limnocylindrales bacterium]